jgi:hypothetical protein
MSNIHAGGDGSRRHQSAVVHNEQTKLLANALDRASTACLTVGVFGPIAVATFGTSNITAGFWPSAVCALGWFLAGFSLHMYPQRALRSLI